MIRANAGSISGVEDGNHSPILSDEPHIWYIVHYNAPYVRHCLSALIPTTYSNISSDIEKSLKKDASVPLGFYPIKNSRAIAGRRYIVRFVGHKR